MTVHRPDGVDHGDHVGARRFDRSGHLADVARFPGESFTINGSEVTSRTAAVTSPAAWPETPAGMPPACTIGDGKY